MVGATSAPSRADLYLRFRVEQGAFNRWGPGWETDERVQRIEHELSTILTAGFSEYFLILASILDFCRDENIPYGPGRGSVGGSLLAYLLGITEVDPLEWDLLFERFLNPDRVAYPDVDLDFSQVRRPEVLDFIRRTYQRDGNVVLQVAAFARAGARSVIEQVLNAKRESGDPTADSTAMILRGCLPEGSITGGSKAKRELAAWLDGEGHGDRDRFRETAEAAGWLEPMLKLDSLYTHLARHAAGVVILNEQDLKKLPRCSADGEILMTGFDMYDLDELGYLKIDALGLRTLDVLADAHKFTGGSGSTPDLMAIWREHMNDPEPYKLLQEADTLGIFQMETSGYRRTLKDFQPTKFDHIVQLNALYRPGALDFKTEDGRTMVDVFIDRHHHNEMPTYLTDSLIPILRETHGVILYQEQSMKIATELAGFTMAEADALRKAIGKKRKSEMDKLAPMFQKGCEANAIPAPVIKQVWENIEAAARYSWNKSHAVEYGVITWLTVWFKHQHPTAFYAALLNSYEGDKDRMADTIAEARQRVTITPPDINVAQEGFTVDGDHVVFGLLGVKGLGEDGRNRILVDRLVNGPYSSFQEFVTRLPSLPIDKKLALIRSGAMDNLDRREWLLATTTKPGKGKKCEYCEGTGGQMVIDDAPPETCNVCGGTGRIPVIWTVAEHLNHNRNLKNPREVPPVHELTIPTDQELSSGEAETVGFYVSTEPLAEVAKALARVSNTNHFGGEVEKLYKKNDRNNNEMATITLLTPALTKRRVLVFSSVWLKYRSWLKPGVRVLMRGREDGDTILADAFWEPDDVRHFKNVKLTRGTEETTERFDGKLETLEHLQARGYEVCLL